MTVTTFATARAIVAAAVDSDVAEYGWQSQDVMDRMRLLTEVEALRRFVLVRGALLKGLQQKGSKGVSLGKELCDSLRGMVGEVPELVKTCSLQGARNMERDTRRAIASMTFVASMDPSFV